MDLTKPPTEVEIAELNDAQLPAGKNILRRLAFQRDILKTENTDLRERLKLCEDTLAVTSEYSDGLGQKLKRLEKELTYKNLYISYLVGAISKAEFKIKAAEFAEPLNIEQAIAAAKELK